MKEHERTFNMNRSTPITINKETQHNTNQTNSAEIKANAPQSNRHNTSQITVEQSRQINGSVKGMKEHEKDIQASQSHHMK